MKTQLERSRDALEELRRAPFWRLVGRPGDAANVRHGRNRLSIPQDRAAIPG